jgi:tetratricopeptide (TPR) repeat protein
MSQCSLPLMILRTLALSAMMACGLAHADDYGEVNQLLRSGKTQQALERADSYLAKNPRDPQMRFLRGVAQTDAGQTDEAIASFNQLIEDYPELPEPYNNLAVIYANTNQLDRARMALEMAVRNNPAYSVAHENLGDIYARLAYAAYANAQGNGGQASTLRPKMELLRQLLEPHTKLPVMPSNTRPSVGVPRKSSFGASTGTGTSVPMR